MTSRWLSRSPGESRDTGVQRSRSRRRAWWGLAAAGLVIVLYGGIGFAVTTFVIGNHARWRESGRIPADVGLAGDTVSLRATDGTAVKAWWIPAVGVPRGTVVIAHGVDHTREVMLPRAAFLARGGYHVLVLDLRGHGASEGEVVSPGVLESRDVLAGARYARLRAPRLGVAALGISYGAVASLRAAARPGALDAVIADGAFMSTAVVYRNIVHWFVHGRRSPPWLRAASACAALPGIVPAISLVYYARTGVWLGLDFGSLEDVAPRVRAPVLLVSGGGDWLVPTADARRLQAALASARTSLVVIPGAAHDGTYDTAPALYRTSVLSFLATALPPPGEIHLR